MLCMVAVIFGTSFISHAEPTKGAITGNTVNVRQTASTTATVLEKLDQNDLVDVLAETTDSAGVKWYKITTASGVTGYVRADLVKKATVTVEVKPTDDKTAYISGATVNIRQDANTTSPRVANAKGGSQITIIGEATGSDGYKWYQVEFNANGTTMTGFVRSDLITFQKPTQAPEVTEIEGEMSENVSETPSEVPTEPSEPTEVPSEDASIPVSSSADDLVIMEPNSIVEILPKGFEQTELKFGDDYFTVWGKGDFYVVYASVNDGTPQFYLYDSKNESYVAYTGLLAPEDVASSTPATESKGMNYKLIAIIAIVVVVILLIVIGVLAYKLANADYNDDYDDDDNDNEHDNATHDDVFIDVDDDDDDDIVFGDDGDDDDDEDDDNGEIEVNERVTVSAKESKTTVINPQILESDTTNMSSQISEVVAKNATDEYTYDVEEYEGPVYEEDSEEYSDEDDESYLMDEQEEAEDDESFADEDDNQELTDEEEASKPKKKFSQRLLDYFTVEVDEDDDDDDEQIEESKKNKRKDRTKKERVKKSKDNADTVSAESDDDDDDLLFIDL